MPIKDYSTKIAPEKTIAEIQARLVKNGARKMGFRYDDAGNLESITFNMDVENLFVSFCIAPNFEGVLAALKRTGAPKNLLTTEQAVRVAWRIEKDWLEAQLAKIESGLATPFQLLLPYAVTDNGQTFYQKVIQSGTKFINQ